MWKNPPAFQIHPESNFWKKSFWNSSFFSQVEETVMVGTRYQETGLEGYMTTYRYISYNTLAI